MNERAAPATDRTVTHAHMINVCVNLESDSAAVTRTLIRLQHVTPVAGRRARGLQYATTGSRYCRITLCMSGGRRPQAEANWQAPLASGPLDALVGQQYHNVTLGYEHGFGL